jgi:hypothetical protein
MRQPVPARSPPSHASQTPLKDQNRIPLIAVLVLNLAALVLAITTGSLLSPGLDQFVQQWQALLSAGVGVILAGVVNGLLSSETKTRIVFWRWSDPLPGSFAFSHYAERDPRINMDNLKKKVGKFPALPREQNALWYKLYRSVSDHPAIIDGHRSFLLTRDYAGMALLLLLAAGPIAVWQIPSQATASIYTGLLLLQYLLASQAARNYGIRLVTTVLALKASD